MQDALETLWGYAQQLFVALPDEDMLVRENMFPDLAEVKSAWLEHVTSHLKTSDLAIPTNHKPQATSRTQHTDYLSELLADLQQVARLEPQGTW